MSPDDGKVPGCGGPELRRLLPRRTSGEASILRQLQDSPPPNKSIKYNKTKRKQTKNTTINA